MKPREVKSILRIIANLQKQNLFEILDVKEWAHKEEFDHIWDIFETKGTLHGLLNLSEYNYKLLMGYCHKLIDARTSENTMKIENFRRNDLVQFDPLYEGYAKCIGTVKEIHHEYNTMIVEIQNAMVGETPQQIIEVECSPDEIRFCGVGIFV